MNEDREPSPEDYTFSDDSEVDYKDIVFQQEEERLPVHLEKKDYMALFVASLETIFLPLVILGLMLIVLGLIFSRMY